jgi:hypothetical protein
LGAGGLTRSPPTTKKNFMPNQTQSNLVNYDATNETNETNQEVSTEKPSEPMQGGMEVPVPLESLAMPGEDDKLNNPEVGDPVQLMAEGTVSRIEGQTAYVKIKSVNGKPVGEEGAKVTDTPEDTDGDNEFNQLRSEAQSMDEQG